MKASGTQLSISVTLITHLSWVLEEVEEVTAVLKVLVVLEAILQVVVEDLEMRCLSFLIWVQILFEVTISFLTDRSISKDSISQMVAINGLHPPVPDPPHHHQCKHQHFASAPAPVLTSGPVLFPQEPGSALHPPLRHLLHQPQLSHNNW